MKKELRKIKSWNTLEDAIRTGEVYLVEEKEVDVAETWDEELQLRGTSIFRDIWSWLRQHGYSIKCKEVIGYDGIWPTREFVLDALWGGGTPELYPENEYELAKEYAKCFCRAYDIGDACQHGEMAKCAAMVFELTESLAELRSVEFEDIFSRGIADKVKNKKRNRSIRAGLDQRENAWGGEIRKLIKEYREKGLNPKFAKTCAYSEFIKKHDDDPVDKKPGMDRKSLRKYLDGYDRSQPPVDIEISEAEYEAIGWFREGGKSRQ